MGEIGFGMLGDVVFDRLPAAVLFVADPFAGGADGEQPAEGFDLLKGFLQSLDENFLGLGGLMFNRRDLYGRPQLIDIVWLYDISIGVGVDCLFEYGLIGKAGHENNRHIRLFGDFSRRLDSVHIPLEQDIHGHQIRMMLVYGADGVRPGLGCRAYPVAQTFQACGEHDGYIGVIFHHQDIDSSIQVAPHIGQQTTTAAIIALVVTFCARIPAVHTPLAKIADRFDFLNKTVAFDQ